MKHVSIIVPEGPSNLSSIVVPHNMLSKANEHLASLGKKAIFRIQLVGLSNEVRLDGGMFSVRPEVAIDDVKKTDLIIIPAISPDFTDAITRNKPYVDWITSQYQNGAEVASICTGAFLMAQTGLLNGRNCSTHWVAAAAFRTMFPKVNLVTDQIITDENRIYTNGGAFSFLNLMLHLIEKYCGRETAIYSSKVFEIDISRNCQSPFSIFLGQKNHEDEAIKKAQSYLENNVDKKISVEALTSMLALERRSFDRRFKKATGNSPAEYMQRVKIEAAKKNLENGARNINEVMYGVGYVDKKAFRTIFKKITGLSPLDYRNRYNHLVAVAQ